MKTYLTVVLVCFCSLSVFSQTSLYINPVFESIAKKHKIVAIIPFKASVSLRPKQMKEMTAEDLNKLEKTEGEALQGAMYSWFLTREKRNQLNIKVQDTRTTNSILLKNELTYESIDSKTPKELAELLEVDAVIMGKISTNKPMSEGASLALGVLFGFYGTTNQALLDLFIYNAADGELMVNYRKSVAGSIGSNNDMLVNTLMRKASRRIPYTSVN
jgi:hypothetical protein